jgi:nucleoside permease NupC
MWGLVVNCHFDNISCTLEHTHYFLYYSDENSLLDAATNGALLGIQLVLGIIANLIAFVAFIAFLNGVFSWLGILVGVEGLSFEVSYEIIRSEFNPPVLVRNRLLNLK